MYNPDTPDGTPPRDPGAPWVAALILYAIVALLFALAVRTL